MVELCESNIARTTTINFMTREEFESIQRKFQESGLGIMQFLRQEKINHSTFSKWRRRYTELKFMFQLEWSLVQ